MAVRKYLGQGVRHPFKVDNFGRIALENDSELVKQSLRILFGETIGSELMREHYGSRLRELIFQPNDQIVKGLLDYFIVDAISKWERRIKVIDVFYDQPTDQPALINISVFFNIRQSAETDSFIFPFIRELKN